jgi:hypothetical protein
VKKSTRTIHGSLAWGLVLLLIAENPRVALARPGAPQQGNCELTDHTCQAEHWQRKAASATSPKFKAVYLHAAFLSYLARFDESGDTRALCSAHRALHRSLEIEDQPAEQRTSFEAARAELVSREKQRGVRCGSGQRAAKSKAPIVATVSEPATPTSEQDPPPPFLAVGPASGVKVNEALAAAPSADTSPPVPPEEHAAASMTSSPLAPQVDARGDASRPLTISGAVMLGLGLSLGGVAAYAGARSAALARDGREIQAMSAIMPLDDAALREDAALADGYRTWTSVTIATTITGGVAVVIGATLLGVGHHRKKRPPMALIPTGKGLALHVRF